MFKTPRVTALVGQITLLTCSKVAASTQGVSEEVTAGL